MTIKNYYLILGASAEASPEEIRAAFRGLAKKHHPDMTGGRETAFFQDIAEAYEVLSDPEKRRSYNRRLQEEKTPGENKDARPWGRPGTNFSEKDAMGSLKIMKTARRTTSPTRGPDIFEHLSCGVAAGPGARFREADALELDAYLTCHEASRGVEIELEIPIFSTCTECLGIGPFHHACPGCAGTGKTESPHRVIVSIPPGIRNGTVIRVSFRKPRENYLHLAIHVHIIFGGSNF